MRSSRHLEAGWIPPRPCTPRLSVRWPRSCVTRSRSNRQVWESKLNWLPLFSPLSAIVFPAFTWYSLSLPRWDEISHWFITSWCFPSATFERDRLRSGSRGFAPIDYFLFHPWIVFLNHNFWEAFMKPPLPSNCKCLNVAEDMALSSSETSSRRNTLSPKWKQKLSKFSQTVEAAWNDREPLSAWLIGPGILVFLFAI